MIELLDIILLLFLVVCAVAAINMRDLLSSTVILGSYSLIMAVVWTRLNAVDVAFTEASVGAGITTMLMVAALSRTRRFESKIKYEEKRSRKRFSFTKVSGFIVVILTGAVLIYGTMDMPDFGDPNAPAHTHVARMYLEKGQHEVGVPNIVTAILASYRGFDTLGETIVIFTAGIGVILMLRKRKEL
jgi:multicomponent Na+:H+ antiporter subunit B